MKLLVHLFWLVVTDGVGLSGGSNLESYQNGPVYDSQGIRGVEGRLTSGGRIARDTSTSGSAFLFNDLWRAYREPIVLARENERLLEVAETAHSQDATNPWQLLPIYSDTDPDSVWLSGDEEGV